MTDLLFDGLDDDPTPPPYEAAAPHGDKPKNIILFGETGAGKSAVINLISGAEVAPTSGDAEACTLQATPYSLTLPGEHGSDPEMFLRIFDTIGLEEPQRDHTYLDAIANAHALITTLHTAGGIDLLLFCIRAGRVTAPMQRHYRLFFEIMCERKVPLTIVVTHLEREKVMEEWWVRNEAAFEKYEICSVAHACITAAPAHLEGIASKRAASRVTLQRMLREVLSNPRPAYVQDVWSWFRRLMEMCLEFLMPGGEGSRRRKELTTKLETRCKMPREAAQRVAAMLLTRRHERRHRVFW